MLDNKKLEVDKALLPFILANTQSSNSDPYFQPRTKPPDNMALEFNSISLSEEQLSVFGLDTSKLIFHLDCLIGISRLCILFFIILELLVIA